MCRVTVVVKALGERVAATSIDPPPSRTLRTTLHAGETIRFVLHRSTLEERPARIWSQDQLADRLADTVDAWRSWSEHHQNYDGPWRDLVHHSGRVLQGLTFQPSGAIIAAATTSLPEGVGGERNWERILPHLRGWRGSRPVRVGNDAWSQEQVDVYGEVNAAWAIHQAEQRRHAGRT
jgi:GH15 family glucan-1,4-alpha-glucosidase